MRKVRNKIKFEGTSISTSTSARRSSLSSGVPVGALEAANRISASSLVSSDCATRMSPFRNPATALFGTRQWHFPIFTTKKFVNDCTDGIKLRILRKFS
jgi:hypothetical protein